MSWALNPLDKDRWLKIAQHWLQMAQEADGATDRGQSASRAALREGLAIAERLAREGKLTAAQQIWP
jgi:hypothetical protein